MVPFDCLSLLTDFGLGDGFVAACHGVAARIAPGIPVIDITHLVPPGDLRRGAAVLAQTLPYLPRGVHVAVVDPGVGTARRGVAVRAGEHILVGPDNGVLSWAVTAAGGPTSAHQLTNEEFWVHPVSQTFHGRDVFTPVAAHLATGAAIESVGPPLEVGGLVTLPAPARRVRGGEAEGEVVMVDRFGNLQLSITSGDMDRAGVTLGSPVDVLSGNTRLTALYLPTFAAAAPGDLVVFTDSAGLVSLAVNTGDAARRLGLTAGAAVRLTAPTRS